jgi:HEAT repeat protein
MNDEKIKIVRALFSVERRERIAALQYIVSHPAPFYVKALQRFENEEMDPFVISSFVKAIAACAGSESLPYIVRHLRHSDGRVRANCIEAIGLAGISPGTASVIPLLINFLADIEPRVVQNCIRVLAECVETTKISTIVDDYWDSSDEAKCLNALHLIRELKLQQNVHILQAALNHKSARVREAAEKLKPVFAESLKEVTQYSLRNTKPQRPDVLSQYQQAMETLPEELVQKLSELQQLDKQAEKIELLLKLQKHSEGALLLPKLREMLDREKNEFVLATLVKTIGLLSSDDEWENLKPFLSHKDGRIRSNVLEVFAARLDKRILPFVRETIENFRSDDSSHVRIISASIPFLRSCQPELGIRAMKKLSEGDISSIAAFVTLLPKWKEHSSPELITIIIELIRKEIRKEVLEACLNFLKPQADPELYRTIKQIIHGLKSGQKKQLLIIFAQQIKAEHNIEIIEEEEGFGVEATEDELESDLSDRVARRLKEEKIPASGIKRHLFLVKKNLQASKLLYSMTAVLFLMVIGSGWFLIREFQRTANTEPVAVQNIRFAEKEVQKMQEARKKFAANGVIERINKNDGIIYVKSNIGDVELQLENPTGTERFKKGDTIQLVGIFSEEYDGTIILKASALFHKLRYLTRAEKSAGL